MDDSRQNEPAKRRSAATCAKRKDILCGIVLIPRSGTIMMGDFVLVLVVVAFFIHLLKFDNNNNNSQAFCSTYDSRDGEEDQQDCGGIGMGVMVETTQHISCTSTYQK